MEYTLAIMTPHFTLPTRKNDLGRRVAYINARLFDPTYYRITAVSVRQVAAFIYALMVVFSYAYAKDSEEHVQKKQVEISPYYLGGLLSLGKLDHESLLLITSFSDQQEIVHKAKQELMKYHTEIQSAGGIIIRLFPNQTINYGHQFAQDYFYVIPDVDIHIVGNIGNLSSSEEYAIQVIHSRSDIEKIEVQSQIQYDLMYSPPSDEDKITRNIISSNIHRSHWRDSRRLDVGAFAGSFVLDPVSHENIKLSNVHLKRNHIISPSYIHIRIRGFNGGNRIFEKQLSYEIPYGC